MEKDKANHAQSPSPAGINIYTGIAVIKNIEFPVLFISHNKQPAAC